MRNALGHDCWELDIPLEVFLERARVNALELQHIRVVNQPANREVEVLTQRIHDVNLIGLAEDVAALSAGSVIAEIDAGDLALSEGQQTVPVTIRIPGSSTVFAVGSYTALVETKPTRIDQR